VGKEPDPSIKDFIENKKKLASGGFLLRARGSNWKAGGFLRRLDHLG
jgi:hypothetical protein